MPTKTDITFMMNDSLPVDVKGTVKLPQLPTRELVGDFMTSKHITDELLCEHFLQMIQTMFNGIAAKDTETLLRIAEPYFAKKIIEQSANLNLSYEAPSDDAIEKVYLIDKLFIKGVSADRDKNDSNADYVALKDVESRGIRTYVHKFHLGLAPYYYKRQYDDELSKLTEEEAKKDP